MFFLATSNSNTNRSHQQSGHIWILQVIAACRWGDKTGKGPAGRWDHSTPVLQVWCWMVIPGFDCSLFMFLCHQRSSCTEWTAQSSQGVMTQHKEQPVGTPAQPLWATWGWAQYFGRAHLHGWGLNCQPRVAPGIMQGARSWVWDNTPGSTVLTEAGYSISLQERALAHLSCSSVPSFQSHI